MTSPNAPQNTILSGSEFTDAREDIRTLVQSMPLGTKHVPYAFISIRKPTTELKIVEIRQEFSFSCLRVTTDIERFTAADTIKAEIVDPDGRLTAIFSDGINHHLTEEVYRAIRKKLSGCLSVTKPLGEGECSEAPVADPAVQVKLLEILL